MQSDDSVSEQNRERRNLVEPRVALPPPRHWPSPGHHTLSDTNIRTLFHGWQRMSNLQWACLHSALRVVFAAMTNDERKQVVKELLAKGHTLSQIQDYLRNEKKDSITYMELRLLLSEMPD